MTQSPYIDQTGGTGDSFGALSGSVNSSNQTYTVSQLKYDTGKLAVFLNGQLQTQGSGEDWIELDPSAGTFKFNTAPLSGIQQIDQVTAAYFKTDSAVYKPVDSSYGNLRDGFTQALNEAGRLVRFRYFTPTVGAGSYDDDAALAQSGTDTYVLAYVRPISARRDYALINAGAVSLGDYAFYVRGDVETGVGSGAIFRIGLGSPADGTNEFTMKDDGIISHELNGVVIYRQIMCQPLRGGSILGE